MVKNVRPRRGRSQPAADVSARRFRVDDLFAPADITPLVYFRILFGVLAMALMGVMLYYPYIDRYYIQPTFHFTYYGFDWVRPWTGGIRIPLTDVVVPAMRVHFYGLTVLCAMIAAGFLYRISTTLFFLGYTYVFLLEKARYLNHYYLVCLIAFLLIFMPAHRKFSVDARLWPRLRADVIPAWPLWLLRFQIGIVYFFAGVAKLEPDWLQGAPMRIMLARRVHFPIVGPYFSNDWVVAFFAYGGLLLDLCIFPALLFKRMRWIALAAAVFFHLLNSQMFNIDIFPWFMLGATFVLFFPDKLPYRGAMPDVAPATSTPLDPRRRATVALLALYVAIQTLVPLRQFVYPGDTNWTDAGQQFAWRMLVRTKQPSVARFMEIYRRDGSVVRSEVQLAKTDREWRTHWQMGKMVRDPDMILQFAKIIRDDRVRNGGTDVKVYAMVPVALNGREPQLLVNPEVDLASQPRRIGPYPFVLPLQQPLPDNMKLWK